MGKLLEEWKPNRGEINIITKRWSSETLEDTLERVVNGVKNVHPDIKINIEVQDVTTLAVLRGNEAH